MLACSYAGLRPPCRNVPPLDYIGSVARYARFKIEVGGNTYHTHGFHTWHSVILLQGH